MRRTAFVVSGAALFFAVIVVVGCSEPTPARVSAPVVYGEVDDRLEPYEHPSAVHRAIAESAIVMEMSARSIDESDPANVRITYTRTLDEAKDLCPGVRYAEQLEPGTCSGTLIDRRHVLTAAHCVDEERDCDGSRVWLFDFRYEAAGRLATLTSDDVYRCSRVLAVRNADRVDHAIVELDRDVVGHAPVTVRVPAAPLALGTELVLIGHPNGIPMKIASGGFVTWSEPEWLQATLDAFSGNSGSGVFDLEGNLVALLDSGETDYVASAEGCQVINVIDPPPTDDGEGLTAVRSAIDALCRTPGLVSPLCDCGGAPCVDALPGDTCERAEILEPRSQIVRGTLDGFAGDAVGSCGGAGQERFYTITLSEPSRLRARTSGSDTVVYVLAGCDGEERACNDDVSDDDRGSVVEVVLGAGTYVIAIDAYEPGAGAFELELEIEGAPPDAGTAIDAGSALEDGGAVMPDAGTIAPPVAPSEGCGCRATGTSRRAPWALLVPALLLFRRRGQDRARKSPRSHVSYGHS